MGLILSIAMPRTGKKTERVREMEREEKEATPCVPGKSPGSVLTSPLHVIRDYQHFIHPHRV
jgi:hypothetical protein